MQNLHVISGVLSSIRRALTDHEGVTIIVGCDIHVALEGRPVIEEHWWPLATEVYLMRNYHLFGALAGVGDTTITPVVQARGLPADCTDDTRRFYEHGLREWGEATHTASWLTYDELRQAAALARAAWAREYEIKAFRAVPVADQWRDTSLQAVIDYLTQYECHDIVTRIVFFFDN